MMDGDGDNDDMITVLYVSITELILNDLSNKSSANPPHLVNAKFLSEIFFWGGSKKKVRTRAPALLSDPRPSMGGGAKK